VYRKVTYSATFRTIYNKRFFKTCQAKKKGLRIAPLKMSLLGFFLFFSYIKLETLTRL